MNDPADTAPGAARTNTKGTEGNWARAMTFMRPFGLGFMLTYEQRCVEIVTQSELLRSHIEYADLTTPVPSCPAWNVGQLVRHLGGGQRWAETTIRTRATTPPSDESFRDLSAFTDEDSAVLGPWLIEGANQLADTLQAAGPDVEVWTPVPDGKPTPDFWARRFANEMLVHRADAALALGTAFTTAHEVALDAFDEWLELGSIPQIFEQPEMRELLGPGRTVQFVATDPSGEQAAAWLVDLTGTTMTWRRVHDNAAVTVRGPLIDLLLLVYRRGPIYSETVRLSGDVALLESWLERSSFG